MAENTQLRTLANPLVSAERDTTSDGQQGEDTTATGHRVTDPHTPEMARSDSPGESHTIAKV